MMHNPDPISSDRSIFYLLATNLIALLRAIHHVHYPQSAYGQARHQEIKARIHGSPQGVALGQRILAVAGGGTPWRPAQDASELGNRPHETAGICGERLAQNHGKMMHGNLVRRRLRYLFQNFAAIPDYGAYDPVFQDVFHAWQGSLGFRRPVGRQFCAKSSVCLVNQVIHPVVDFRAGLQKLPMWKCVDAPETFPFMGVITR